MFKLFIRIVAKSFFSYLAVLPGSYPMVLSDSVIIISVDIDMILI